MEFIIETLQRLKNH